MQATPPTLYLYCVSVLCICTYVISVSFFKREQSSAALDSIDIHMTRCVKSGSYGSQEASITVDEEMWDRVK